MQIILPKYDNYQNYILKKEPLCLQEIYNFGPFPTPILTELRQKFSFNITPFQQLSSAASNTPDNGKVKQTIVGTNSDELKLKDNKRSKTKMNTVTDDETTATADEEIVNFMSCFTILSSPSRNNRSMIEIF